MKNIRGALIVLLIVNLLFFTLVTVSAEDMESNMTTQSGDVQAITDDNLKSSLPVESNICDIQTEIDAANDGDTIRLDGAYASNGTPVTIKKSVNVIGYNDAVIRNNYSQIFSVDSPGEVSFKNIKFINTDNDFEPQPFLNVNNTRILFYNCTFVDSKLSIKVLNSPCCVISNCSFLGTTKSFESWGMINLRNGTSEISNCIFQIKGDALLINLDMSRNSVIKNCVFENVSCYEPIDMWQTYNCNVSDCNFTNVKASGRIFTLADINNSCFKNINLNNCSECCFSVNGFENSKIINCNFTNTDRPIYIGQMMNSSIVNCTISNADIVYYHTTLVNCSGTNSSIVNTTLANNRHARIDYGLALHGSGMTVDNCRFENNYGQSNYFIYVKAKNTTIQNSFFKETYGKDLYYSIGWIEGNGTLKGCYFEDDKNRVRKGVDLIYSVHDVNIIKTHTANLTSANNELSFTYMETYDIGWKLVDENGLNITGLRYVYFYRNPDFTDYVGTLKMLNGKASIDEGFDNVTGGVNILYANMKGYTFDLADREVKINLIAKKVNMTVDHPDNWIYDTRSYLEIKIVDEDGGKVSGTVYAYYGGECIAQSSVNSYNYYYLYFAPKKAGECNITVKFINDNHVYEVFEKNITIDAGKKTLRFNQTYLLGDVFAANLQDGAGKQIILNFTGNVFNNSADENGWARFDLSGLNLKTGSYPYTVRFAGDDFYNPCVESSQSYYYKNTQSGSDSGSFKTDENTNTKVEAKQTAKIVASKKTFKVKAKVKKYVLTLKSGKNPIKNVKVKLKIKGKTYTAKTNSKGKATFKIKLNKKGKYNAVITFDGNSKFVSAKKTVKLTVKK